MTVQEEIEEAEKRLKFLKRAEVKDFRGGQVRLGMAFYCVRCKKYDGPPLPEKGKSVSSSWDYRHSQRDERRGNQVCYECQQKERHETERAKETAKHQWLVGASITDFYLNNYNELDGLQIQANGKVWKLKWEGESDYDGGCDVSLEFTEMTP